MVNFKKPERVGKPTGTIVPGIEQTEPEEDEGEETQDQEV